MPTGAVEQQHGMGAPGDVPADLIKMELHGVSIGIGQSEPGRLAARRADGPEQIGILVALVGGLPRSGAAPGPLPDNAVLLPDTGLVLLPNLNRLALGQVPHVRAQRAREVFLNAAITSAS